MPQVIKNDIKIVIIHDDGGIGLQWKAFIEDLFTVELPEECRDLGLDVITESISNLNGDVMNNILSCVWRLFIFSRTMLQALQDQNSPLYKSDLFDSDANKNIVLILGGQEDVRFVEEARHALIVFPDYPDFHVIQATSTEKIFNSVISIVSPLGFVFHPNVLSTEDRDQYISLIANKAYPSCEQGKYVVQFSDGSDVVEVEATLFNPCTLVLENPGHCPGVVDVTAYHCPNGDITDHEARKKIGEPVQAMFQSELDKLQSILEKVPSPFAFLCQALNVKSKDSQAAQAVDKALTQSFQKQIPEDNLARVFGTDQGVKEHDDGPRKEYVPTLLHFAALHGLCNLTAQLLRCPGSVRAFGTPNCDGDFPTNLAEKAGHWDLKDYMNSYMEVSAMVDYEMGNSKHTSQMMSSIVTGQYYLSFSGSEAESIYESITSASGSGNIPGYLRMKPLSNDAGLDLPCYDSPFIVPIPCADESPCYESMLKQMIESEDTYMSFNDVFQECSLAPEFGHAPSRPPRDYPMEPSGAAWNSSTSGNGANRTSYEALTIPKVVSYLTPAQQELISLQQKVKSGELTTNQAVLRFKEWERKHKEQAASFQFQQECLQRIRLSLMKSKEQKRSRGESDEIEITSPIISGSSTYDMVLRKANKGQAKEITYGAVPKAKPRTISNTSLSSPVEETFSNKSRRFAHNNASGFSRMSSRSRGSNRSSGKSLAGASPGDPPYPTGNTTTRNFGAPVQNSVAGRPPPVPPRDSGAFPDAPIVPPRAPIHH